jgi:8-oxo-dGTP pyrophosphatase MutT (NUDIX family)
LELPLRTIKVLVRLRYNRTGYQGGIYMEIEYIKEVLRNKSPKPEGKYEVFGVMIPLIEVNGSPHVLMEVRSTDLKNQPGEISFPGGRMEEGETPAYAAFRETMEELLVPEDSIQILGALDYLVTPFNYIIYPYVGVIKGIKFESIKGNPGEVEKIFAVPLYHFLNNKPRKYQIHVKIQPLGEFPFELIPGGSDYNWKTGTYPVYFYKYGEIIIWGITARIINNFIEILK